ncbi:tyrosine-protein phosphatase [Streptomyces sp. SS7]|uniref:tyrosine-protein phosphatase n=1 Tax=Streptomyces sp. SS7 TaxID=3108485 RepID=UPI0030EC6C2C
MDRHPAFDSPHTFRDLGGYRTTDGLRVRPGRLYRADSPGDPTKHTADRDRFPSLSVGTAIDLRTEKPATALGLIARARSPLAFHCASGNDRTDRLAALVLALLGVPDDTIVFDCTLTELAGRAPLSDGRIRNEGRSPARPAAARAPESVMRLFLASLRSRYGSVESYVTTALGVDAAPLSVALRAHLLEPVPATWPPLTFRRATPAEAPLLVRLRDTAALWQLAHGIDQWKPGEKDETHFRDRMESGEVWLSHTDAVPTGAYELWWSDPAAWGPRPPDAGYVHRLMTTPYTAPPATGRALLAHAESRIAAAGRPYARLDCLSSNPRLRAYYEAAGYTVVGEQREKDGGSGSPYAVTLLEKRL